MANQETQKLDSIIASRRALLMGAGAAVAAMAIPSTAHAAKTVAAFADTDILNFALNLEYLESNFYYMAAFGSTIDNPTTASIALGQPSTAIGIGAGTATTTGGTRATVGTATNVPWVLPAVKAYAIETAIEEGKHVTFLRTALGSAAVGQPQIDISPAGAFTTLATAAGLSAAPFVTAGQFNPYANDVAFLGGAYVFEDVGVTAYKGAAPLISTSTTGKTYLQAAASILAVEAYHAGLIRTTIAINDQTGANGYLAATRLVSQLRTFLASRATATTAPTTYTPDDLGLQAPGAYPATGTVTGAAAAPTVTTVSLAGVAGFPATNTADGDPTNVIAFSRTTAQVLNIVTGTQQVQGTNTINTGVFFPAGLNGLFQ